jgi:hypothetical protein
MSEKKHKFIVPEELPSPLRFLRKRGEYDECLEEFFKSNFKSVRVAIPDAKPVSLYRQLNKRLKKKGLREKVKVCIRSGKVYLVKQE